ncbi:MAG: GGDEF domain-containing protein [Nitriliruptoraceae bacterium]
MRRFATAVPVAFDALRPIASWGSTFYLAFAALVYWSFRDDISLLIPVTLTIFGLVLAIVRTGLSSRLAPLLEHHALAVVTALAFTCASIPLLFMIEWQRPYPGTGMALITVAVAALIHHRVVAIALVAWCTSGWLWAATTFGVPVPWGVFATELVMVLIVATILHLAGTRTVRRLDDARQEIAVVAGTDDLTGVANTRRVYEEGQQRLQRLVDRDRPMSMIYLDMDDLKSRNDAGGHLAGDRALKRLATVVRSTVRPTDLVGRVGGDEFVVICEDLNHADALALASRLATELETHQLAASIGIATASTGDADFERLLDAADQQMYRQKLARKARQSAGKSPRT